MAEFEVIVTSGEICNLSFRVQKHRRYKAQETDDGIIIMVPGALVPAVVVPEEPPSENPEWELHWGGCR